MPYIVDNIVTAVYVDGNYGHVSDMIFSYKNTGFAPIRIDINYFVDDYNTALITCGGTNDEYDIIEWRYSVNNANPTSVITGFPFYGPSNQGILLDVGDILYINQVIKMTGCPLTACNTGVKNMQFKWQCHNRPDLAVCTYCPGFCDECQDSYVTPFAFDYEVPKYELTLETPNDFANYDVACAGTANEHTWKVRVRNTSTSSTLQKVELTFENPAALNGLTIIKQGNFQLSPFISCAPCNTTFAPASSTLAGTTPCSSSVALKDFTVIINELAPGDYADFEFKTEKCCLADQSADWNNLLQVNKAFNQWKVTAKGTTPCFDQIAPATTPPQTGNNLIVNAYGGISTHSNSIVRDIDLNAPYTMNGTDMDGPDLAGNTYSYGDAGAKSEEHVRFNFLTGDDFDLQVLGYDGTNGATGLSGILRASIDCQVEGLVIYDMLADIELTYMTGPAPGTPATLYPIATYTNAPGFYTFTVDGLTYPKCLPATYNIYYNLGTLTKDKINDLFMTGDFKFILTPCCPPGDNAADYEVTFSLLPNNAVCDNFIVTATPSPQCTVATGCSPCCWIPLKRVLGQKILHCPGCRAPGIVVNRYDMYRNTFGFEDDNNDRIADAQPPVLIVPGTYNNALGIPYPINIRAAVHGDALIDTLTAVFQHGDIDIIIDPPSDPTLNGDYDDYYRGYSYNIPHALTTNPNVEGDMISETIFLNTLQLNRTIPSGGCSEMDIEVISADLYIDQRDDVTPSIINDCIDCDANYNATYETVLAIHFPTAAFTVAPLVFYEEAPSTTDKEMMFSFNVNDINTIPVHTGATTFPASCNCAIDDAPYSGTFIFQEKQKYRLVTRYRIKGNITGDYYPVVTSQIYRESKIKNWMWLTGNDRFTLASGPLNHNNFFQMPNILYDASDPQNNGTGVPPTLYPDMESAASINPAPPYGFALDECMTSNPPGSCTPPPGPYPSTATGQIDHAIQTNLADDHKFFCEPRGNVFYFYSTDYFNVTKYQKEDNSSSCLKRILTTAESTTGRGMFGLGNVAGNQDLFPYEFRPPALLPNEFVYDNINVFTLQTASPIEPQMLNGFYLKTGGYDLFPHDNNSVDIPIDVTTQTTTTSPFTINLTGETYDCATPSNVTNFGPARLFTGDQFCRFISKLYFEPNDCLSNLTGILPEHAVVYYEDWNFINGVLNTTNITVPKCTPPLNYEYEAQNQPNIVQQWQNPNPNLNLVFNPPNIDAHEHTVCWQFDLYNQNTSVLITSAPNLFLQVPFDANLFNWNITYSYTDGQTSSGPLLQTLTLPDTYFNLFPIVNPNFPCAGCDEFTFPSLPPGAYPVSGTVCAEYAPCFENAVTDLVFGFGWNCSDDFSTPPCSTTEASVSVETMQPNVQVVPGSLNNSGPVVLCSSQNFIEASYTNIDEGSAILTGISFNNAVNFNVQSVVLTNCSTQQTLTYSQSTGGVWGISPNDLSSIGYSNDNFGQAECITVRAYFEPLCFPYINLQANLLSPAPEIILGYASFCDEQLQLPVLVATKFVKAVFDGNNSVQISSTNCHDCYIVTKTANPTQVISGTDVLTYSFEICSYNILPLAYNTIDLHDHFPGGFAVTGANPFVNDLYPPISTSSLPLQGCVQLPDLQGVMTGNGNICNDATIYDVYNNGNGTLLSTSQACVDVVPNCEPPNSDFAIIPVSPLTTVQLSSVLPQLLLLPPFSSVDVQGTLICDVNATLYNLTFMMEPGSQIIVNPGLVMRFANCVFHACNSIRMWRGIRTLSPVAPFAGATLDMRDCYVIDAEYGVEAMPRTTVLLARCYFYDNYIGVYTQPLQNAQAGAINGVTLSITDCTFEGTGTLLKPYFGQATTLGKHPFAGIDVSHQLLDLSASDFRNFFINMSNGVVARQSDVNITDSYFENIQPDFVYDVLPISNSSTPTFTFNGSSIYAFGGKNRFRLTQSGFGYHDTDDKSFVNCKYGVFADNIGLDSRYNHMDVVTAYHTRLARDIHQISDNLINATGNGMELIIFDHARNTFVERNTINFGTSGGANFYAITAQGTLHISDHFITDNVINFNSGSNNAYCGIWANAVNLLQITNNIITMTDNNWHHDGIYMSGSQSSIIGCNRVTGGDNNYNTTSTQAAISNFMGDDIEINCNTVTETNLGFNFMGVITNNVDNFKGNYMQKHQTGLHLGDGAIIETQDVRGNYWIDPQTLANILTGHLSAEWLGLNPPIGSYPFRIQPNQIPPGGASTVYYPIFNGGVLSYVNPTAWFLTSPFANIDCDGDPGVDCPGHGNFGNFGLTAMDMQVAEDSVENDPYTLETKWMQKKQLYEKVDDNPSLQNNATINNFYVSQQGTVIAEINPIEDNMQNLFVTDSITDSTLVQLQNTNEQNASLLGAQVAALQTALTQGTATAGILNNIANTQNNIITVSGTAGQIVETADSLRTNEALLIDADNLQLAPVNSIEENEKKVNEIFLNTIAKGIYEFTQQQINDLHDIAIQCPMLGGNAVFRARALYALINPNMFYDDRGVCNQAGIALRKKEKDKKPKATIYPNPANEKATLVYKFNDNESGRLEIKNMIGQDVAGYDLSPNNGELEFSTRELKPGLYYCIIKDSHSLVENIKIAIIR